MLEGLWLFPLLGIVAGVLAGLLGIGGGLVLVAALVWLLPAHGVPKEAAMHAALASSMASIVMTAASSAYAHHRRGGVLWPTVGWMVPGLLLGGWLGSLFAVAIDGDVLRLFVAAYCFIAGAQMAFGGTRKGGSADVVPRGPVMSLAGIGIGAVSAVVGIGGGSMTVPLLIWRGVTPVRAVGTSSACGVAIGHRQRGRLCPQCPGRGLARACHRLCLPAGRDRGRPGLGPGRAVRHPPGPCHQRAGPEARIRGLSVASSDYP